MELKERIKRLGEYFRGCNIGEGAICVGVKFPETWIIPDSKILNETYKTVVQCNKGIFYFMTEIENGENDIFLAIDNVIQSNKEIELKTSLLKIKAKELTELFENEPLEKLKTLTFVFDNKGKTRKITKAKTAQGNVEEVVKEERITPEGQIVTNVKTEMLDVNNNEEVSGENSTIDGNNSLMDLAVSLMN